MQWPDDGDSEALPLHELIGLIYETAEDPGLWPLLLSGLMAALPNDDAPSKTPATLDVEPADMLARLAGDELAETLIPHFQRALRLNRRLAETTQQRERAMAILEHLPLSVILATETAEVKFMNGRARALLESAAPLTLREGQLSARGFQDTVALRDLIRTAVVSPDGGGTLSLDSDPPVSVLVLPCSEGPELAGDEACCSIFVAALDLDDHLDPGRIRDVFGLSRAEARLTHALVRGRSIEAAAEELHISPHTARTQLKAVFGKTGTRRQPDLIRKVLTSPAVLGHGTPAPTAPARHVSPPVTERFITLRDGRRLCYAEHGDPDGVPVLFQHSIIGSRLETHPDTGLTGAMGIRWIVPERPGFGQSDSQPERSFRAWAEDVRELADHLGLERFHVAGFSSGGAHAAAVAHYLPERVVRTALISSMAPYTSLAALKNMPPTNRMLMAMAHFTPGLLIPFMRIMVRGLIRNPVQITHRHEELWPEADRQAMARPGTREQRVAIFREALRQGPDAVVGEQILLGQDWDFDPGDISGPVDIWHGDSDIHVPIEMIGPLLRIANHRLFRITGHGHYLLLSHWREIFQNLITPPALSPAPAR